MYACPSCWKPLARSPAGAVEHWGCRACGGRAFTYARLGRSVPPEFAAKVREAVDAGGRRGIRRCPLCAMHFLGLRVEHRGAEYALDFCDQCRLVWFDPGEHDAATGRRTSPPAPCPDFDAPNRNWMRVLPSSEQPILEIFEEDPPRSLREAPAYLGLPVTGNGPTWHRPWATWSLAAAASVVTAAGVLVGMRAAVAEWGLVPRQPFRHGGLDFVSSFFLHADGWHLLANLLWLFAFGPHAEDLLRPGRYVLLVALAALAGDLLYVALAPGSRIPTVGASGGISGLLAYYALSFPRSRVRVLEVSGEEGHALAFALTARTAFVAWLAVNALLAHLLGSGVTGVNYAAHLGGAAVGAALWFLWRE